MEEQLTSVGLGATFSCEPVGAWLEWWLAAGLGSRVKLRHASYGALQDELRAPVAFSGAAACVGLLRLADWQRGAAGFDGVRFEADLALFMDSVRDALGLTRRLLLILCPAPAGPSAPTRAALAAATQRLQALAAEEPRLSVVSAAEVKRWYPCRGSPYDSVGDEIGHLPYTDAMCCALAAAAARALLPSLAPPLKLVVVDCDYTLWHHAVGEVGALGVRLAPRHLALQKRLLLLRRRGVLICLCSRNTEDDVWQVERTTGSFALLKTCYPNKPGSDSTFPR